MEVSPAREVASATDATAGPLLHLALLGGFELRVDGAVVTLPASGERLLALLAIHQRPASRSWVAGVLWPDRDEARAAACLRSTLWRLRQPTVELIAITGDRLAIAEAVEVDLHQARTSAWRVLNAVGALDHPDQVPPELVAGDLLPDWYDDWVLIEQERVRQLRVHALEELSSALTAVGRAAAAVDAALLAVRCDPLRETAQGALLRAHLAEGNRADAVRQYRAYERLLATELGVTPSAELASLLEQGGAGVPEPRHHPTVAAHPTPILEDVR
jgi:DNA-binding SARP family transcriptional activator